MPLGTGIPNSDQDPVSDAAHARQDGGGRRDAGVYGPLRLLGQVDLVPLSLLNRVQWFCSLLYVICFCSRSPALACACASVLAMCIAFVALDASTSVLDDRSLTRASVLVGCPSGGALGHG